MNAYDIDKWKGRRVRHRIYKIEGTVEGPWTTMAGGALKAQVRWDNGASSVDPINDLEEIPTSLWNDMRVWYPPGDPQGKWHRTQYVGKKQEGATVTVEVKLIPEEKGNENGKARKLPHS